MNRIVFFVVSSLLAITLAAIGLYWYLSDVRSHYEATVDHSNVSKMELVNTGAESKKTIKLDDPSIRLPFNSEEYEINYQASSGYADGTVKINVNQKEITIDPSLDESTLKNRFALEETAIATTIRDQYPTFNQIYSIQHEALYHDATWYGAVLEYTGNGIFNRDSVALIMQKEGDEWQPVTEYPMPSVNQPTYPDTPYYMLEDLNQRLHAN